METNKQKSIQEQFYNAINSFSDISKSLNDYDTQLQTANIIVDVILNEENIDEQLLKTLKLEAFDVYAKLQYFIKKANKQLNCYERHFKDFFEENEREKQLYDIELAKIKPVLDDKKKFVDEQIDKCFKCIRSYYENENNCE